MFRQIVLDTETTGLDPASGHKIIEIGCVELLDREFTGNNFHVYINPQRKIESGAELVHGITAEFLADKPTFADVVDDFLTYITGVELIAHNAKFDVGFLDYEIKSLSKSKKRALLSSVVTVFDTLALARKKNPGQRNTLDALCKRYQVDNSKRELHGALLDASLLAEVYLRMTGGQISLFDDLVEEKAVTHEIQRKLQRRNLVVIRANAEEEVAHQAYLERIKKF